MEDIFELAMCSKNGEYAWKITDVSVVVERLKQSKLAIIDGDVLIVNAKKEVNELYWFSFKNISEKTNLQSWESYVETTASEFLITYHQIKDDKSLVEEKKSEGDEVYLQISFLTEEEYQELSRKVDDYLDAGEV